MLNPNCQISRRCVRENGMGHPPNPSRTENSRKMDKTLVRRRAVPLDLDRREHNRNSTH